MAKRKGVSVIYFAVFLITAVMLLAGNVYAKRGRDAPVLVSRKNLVMEEGSSSRIKINGNNILQIKYSSSDKQVAGVNKKGKITAKSTGVCKINISVYYKNAKDSRARKKLAVSVKVKPKEDSKMTSFKISINKKEFDAVLYNTDAAKELYNWIYRKSVRACRRSRKRGCGSVL